MSDNGERSVSGTWFGNYYYSSVNKACGFEAVFVQSGGAVEGSILDDGQLGEAHVMGTFTGSTLTFSKIYNSVARNPVTYQGVLGDDGKSLSGTWQINKACHGSWTAWRMDDEEVPEITETEEQEELEKEHELQVAPMKSK